MANPPRPPDDWDEPTHPGIAPPEAAHDAPSDPEKPGARRPCLVVVAGARMGEVFPLDDGAGLVVGRDPSAGVALMEAGVSRHHARFVMDLGVAKVVDLESKNGTWVGGQRIGEHALKDGEKISIGENTILKFTYQDAEEAKYQQKLYEAALRDGLTSAFNFRYFQQRLRSEVAFADRHRRALSLVLLDVDRFRIINETLGYVVGDAVLQRLAALLRTVVGAEDVLARTGGEKFGVIVRDATEESALVHAERLRNAITEAAFEDIGRPIEVRVSMGTAAMPHPELRTSDELFARASAAVVRAKRAGRNRVSL